MSRSDCQVTQRKLSSHSVTELQASFLAISFRVISVATDDVLEVIGFITGIFL